jgi:hypothetical protein
MRLMYRGIPYDSVYAPNSDVSAPALTRNHQHQHQLGLSDSDSMPNATLRLSYRGINYIRFR